MTKRLKKWWAWHYWNVPTKVVEARTEAAAKAKLSKVYGKRTWNVYRFYEKNNAPIV